MVIPYTLIKAFSGKGNPNLEELEKVSAEESFEYLMKPRNMKGKYLGACLDSCRIGVTTGCIWKTNIRGLMNFIQRWREENNDNPELYHEMSLSKLYKKFELPYISHDSCPRDKSHSGTITDTGRRIRCSHKSTLYLKPSFIKEWETFDELSQMKTIELFEDTPSDSSYCDEDGDIYYPEPKYENYLKDKARYDSEEPIEVVDICYSILSDKNVILPFETILRRLNHSPETKTVFCSENHHGLRQLCRRVNELDDWEKSSYEITGICPGHSEPSNKVFFCFDGWDLAYYLQKWKEQTHGKEPPWFAKKQEYWTSEPIPYYYD